jgi:hypothetical protein
MDPITRRKALSILLICVLAAALLCLFDYFAPLEFTSVLVYTGITLALAGIVSLAWPLRFLLIATRKIAGVVLAAGLVLVVAGLEWPAQRQRVAQPGCRLDDFLPEYDFYERHAVAVHASPQRTAAALRQVTFDDVGVIDALMRVRAAAGGNFRARTSMGSRPMLDTMSGPGSAFSPLSADGREIVMCMAGRPWSSGPGPRMRGAAEFAAFNAPRSVKIAFNLVVEEDKPGWSRVTTETRVLATDSAARGIMARYWRLIYPGSGMIRRMWLNAIRDRAERIAAIDR